MPPLSSMALDEFKAFEEGTCGGISYGNTYFLEASLLTAILG